MVVHKVGLVSNGLVLTALSLAGIGGTIIHEFGHALGMKHELQSPFQNKIQWNKDIVYKYFADNAHGNWSKEIVDYNILDPISPVGLNGSAFDRYSIMKYVLPSSLLLNPTLSMIQDIEQFNNNELMKKIYIDMPLIGENINNSNNKIFQFFYITIQKPNHKNTNTYNDTCVCI